MEKMTPEIIAAAAGIFLSLLFEYVPGIESWYEKLAQKAKAGIMAGSVVIVVVALVLLSCYGPYDYFACESSGFWEATELLILALITNQTTHRLIKKDNSQ
jgi:hypothetical protein